MCQADQVLAGSRCAFPSLADAALVHRNLGPGSVNHFLSTEHELNTELREVYRCSHTALCCLRAAPQPAQCGCGFSPFKGWAAEGLKSQKGKGEIAGQHSHSPGPAVANQGHQSWQGYTHTCLNAGQLSPSGTGSSTRTSWVGKEQKPALECWFVSSKPTLLLPS